MKTPFCAISLCVAFSVLFSVSALANADEHPTSLADLISVLQKKEKNLQHIAITSEQWAEEAPVGTDNWRRVDLYTSLTAYYNGMPGGPVRFDVEKEIVKWTGGDAAHAESAYSVAFNGEVYKRIDLRTGPAGKVISVTDAQILPKPPIALRSAINNYATGAGFSIYLYAAYEGRSLSQKLMWMRDRLATHPNIPVRVLDSQLNDKDVLLLLFGRDGDHQERWWFDPDRNYSLLAHEVINVDSDGSKRIVFSEHVLQLTEVGPGIWYPMEAVYLAPAGKAAKSRLRYIYRASKAVANAPDFDDRVFSLTIPAGFTVSDQVNNRTYVVAPTTQQLEKDLNQAVEDALKAQEAAPAE